MNENDLVSIVVPIYNVEEFLEQCIKSIINQTYNNLQIILVDDGSKDNSGKLCDQYAEKDNRIEVIHKSNGGLSDARNKGISKAKGKYIVFIDSDDYIESKYIELLYKAIIANNVKISQCGIKEISQENELIIKEGYENKQIKNFRQIMTDTYSGKWGNTVVWNKMYLKELFDDIKFPKGKIHEDEFTTYKIFYMAENIAIIDKFLYNYRQNRESITRKKFNLKRLDILEALEERIVFLNKYNEQELYDCAIQNYLLVIKDCFFKARREKNFSKENLWNLKNKYKNVYRRILKNKNVNYLKKIKWGFYYLFFDIL